MSDEKEQALIAARARLETPIDRAIASSQLSFDPPIAEWLRSISSHPAPKIGEKHDLDKTRWDLMPWRALECVAQVMTYGAKKYCEDGWREVPGWKKRYFSAAFRHILAWMRGEKLDPESGLPHLAHATCCILFLLELDSSGT